MIPLNEALLHSLLYERAKAWRDIIVMYKGGDYLAPEGTGLRMYQDAEAALLDIIKQIEDSK